MTYETEAKCFLSLKFACKKIHHSVLFQTHTQNMVNLRPKDKQARQVQHKTTNETFIVHKILVRRHESFGINISLQQIKLPIGSNHTKKEDLEVTQDLINATRVKHP